MAVNTKRPPLVETVGAQYVCFSEMIDSEYTTTYSEDVEKTEVVKKVSVSENSESTPIIASGKTYTTISQTSSTEISVEVIAFPATTRAKMRGDIVTDLGLIKKGQTVTRPYFAYGKVVELTGGGVRFDWFPKCQLTGNTDEASTKEESFSEQGETLTISAMAFNDDGDICVSYDSDNVAIDGLTEDVFFGQVVMADSDITV